MMSRQDSITNSDFTNFLASGAFLRDRGQVVLLLGPFQPVGSSKTPGVSISCPFFYETEKATFLRPQKEIHLSASDLARFCLRFVEESAELPPSVQWQEPEKQDFEKAFARVQNLILQGQIDKAVPVVFARAKCPMTAAIKARWMLEVLSAPESLHAHGYWDGEDGILGATPEVLFEINGDRLQTMALAGTLAHGEGRGEDLMRSTKDQHEHRMVVEDLRHELKSFGHVQVGETHVFELPTLWHLRTDINVELHEKPDLAPLIHRLHPTAALGVFPRLFGWRWMHELPGQEDRARFGAPFTVKFSEDRVISLVSIRNLQWMGSKILLGSGCGVIKSSTLESEWNELRRKRQSVLKILGTMP